MSLDLQVETILGFRLLPVALVAFLLAPLGIDALRLPTRQRVRHPLPDEPDATLGGHSSDGSECDTGGDRADAGETTSALRLAARRRSHKRCGRDAIQVDRHGSPRLDNCGLGVPDRRSLKQATRSQCAAKLG
ncbi:MAG: hypothetical protein ICV69_14245 [Thermoleophilaceae bacterium]|nr:hypothetical protein [Thermoleophilaceae bacterium]